ncbi:MAG: hypothetical protein IJS15_12675, partial [Victivallales bacterium]|nr:hypothetical protein [Victivallales bacterium]
GTANSTTVNSGYMYGSRGGTANDTVNGGRMYVASGGTANNTVNEGWMSVGGGGTANNTTVNSDGRMVIYDGIANSTTLNMHGSMSIGFGGTANSTTMNGDVSIYVSSGGTANSTTVNYDGFMYIQSGGTAVDIIENGGCVTIRDGATANFIANVISGMTISDNNYMTIHSGTTANNTTVNSGRGGLYIYSGGIHSGSLSIAQGAVVSAFSGAIIDFTVASQEDSAVALINHYDYIRGAADSTYTLTVSAEQATGLYALAGYAEGFDSTVTVRCLAGSEQRDIGTLSVGGAFTNSNRIYKLYKLVTDEDSTLLLQIKEAAFVSNPVADGEGAFDDLIADNDTIIFDESNTVYAYTDGLTATHPLDVIGNGTDATTRSGGSLLLAGNETSFSGLTFDGQMFGAQALSSGGIFADDVKLSFSGVDFTDGARVFGGADVSSTATANVGDITLNLDGVDGGSARIFGAGRVADKANAIVGDIDVTISCADGGSFTNYFVGAEARSGYTGTIVCGTVNTVIDGGEFTYCGNGSQLRGGASVQKDSTLTINGGTFNYYVYAGAFSAGGAATVNGNSTLVINGGDFRSHVFGGCGATNSDNGGNTLVSGNAGVFVNTSENVVSFDANLYAGSMGYGNLSGGTTMTFTGRGSNLSFAANSYVTGNSQMFRGSVQFVGGKQSLVFDGFSGDFSANVNNGFTNVIVSGSNVSFTGGKVVLNAVTDWSIEVNNDAALTLAHGKNSFEGDNLSLTLADGTTPTTVGLDVIAGTEATLAGWDAFSSVSLVGETAAFADGAWSSENYRLYREGNALKLASIA